LEKQFNDKLNVIPRD